MSLYDPNNIFARILRGEIPCTKVYENDHVLAFRDIAPRAPIHVLIIPKGNYTSAVDFYANAPEELVVAFARATAHVMTLAGVVAEEGGRLICNQGTHGGQEVPHFHVHILGGRSLGAMVS